MGVVIRSLPEGQLPKALAERSRLVTLPIGEGVPALIAHPDDSTPSGVIIWMHGRTVDKYLDPGRYNRLLRAGIAVCAIDLPGHGERVSLLGQAEMHDPSTSLDVIAQASGEIDGILEQLPLVNEAIDVSRVAIGGMSLGGMVTLHRLGKPHSFRCASVEATSGNLRGLYLGGPSSPEWPVKHSEEAIARVDPLETIDSFRPIPLLALHSETDQMVPWEVQRVYLDRLRDRYGREGADPSWITVRTWPETGAPREHVGFGRVSHEAKTLQTEFLTQNLGRPPGP